jgi:hypothetical protein
MADFVGNLDRINALAERSAGFIWRLQSDDGNATSIRPLGEDVLVNMSVWRDVQSLSEFVYRSDHAGIMRRRRDWFERMREAFVVLWWVPRGHRPTLEEALVKLERLRTQGPTAEAFSFRQAYGPPDAPLADPFTLGENCPAT